MPPNDSGMNAPEVVRYQSDLIHVPNEMESPEVLQQTYSNLPQHHKTSSSETEGGAGYFPEKESSPLHITLPGDGNPYGKATGSTRRKRLMWTLVAVIVTLAVGLGVGLGVGLRSGSGSSDESVSAGDAAITAPSSSTPSSTPTPTASATTSAVTSGSTGVAQFSCTGGETTESSDGTEYVQECYTMYPAAGLSYYGDTDNVTMRNLGGKNTVYSLEACLDTCDSYNANGNLPACRAVSYYANLTAPINLWGGNCFLKNDRGVGSNSAAVDWHNTASAYRSCLNVTCSGAN